MKNYKAVSAAFAFFCMTACSVQMDDASDSAAERVDQSGGAAQASPSVKHDASLASGPAATASAATIDRGGFFPSELRGAPDVPGSSLCPIDSINNLLTSEFRSVAPESPFKFVGWMAVDSPTNRAPPRVFGGFLDATGNLVGLVEGQRLSRPDLAQRDPQLEDAGFSVEGYAPSVEGTYRIVFWAGDQSGMARCESSHAFVVARS